MNDLRDLYQRTVLDHSRRPRNFRALSGDVWTAELRNVTCGDRILVAWSLDGGARGAIGDIAFQGNGCAISMASASVMTESVKGLSPAEAEGLRTRFTALVNDGGTHLSTGDPSDLLAFGAVVRFPVRIPCATLAWLALHAALEKRV